MHAEVQRQPRPGGTPPPAPRTPAGPSPAPVGPAASLSSLTAVRVAFNNTGTPDADNCAQAVADGAVPALGVGGAGAALHGVEIVFQLGGTIPRGTEFDILRTLSDTTWVHEAGAWRRYSHTPAGTNDDPDAYDECLIPNRRRIFDVDAPGWRTLHPSAAGTGDAAVLKFNFFDWVIARNRSLGEDWRAISRPTFTRWHSISSVAEQADGTWAMQDTPSGTKNEIELGHVDLGAATP